ncbi:hypothetical protein BU25DRAFT_418052 [Macroventuria anomochaeta]|uniref:Uncharacterized protein n=1 Tax=Macroventuria anomochaeta TaxID=301207 RepID=A0ACB6SGA5_9PLEO|nr:uncharacterized protein BU25DRAFT_418052 [Macroventuria anomochaeta]KAF2632354.1 hypothetical protein BU25DRAFT_418052 [Macroventuria anomochaeta]
MAIKIVDTQATLSVDICCYFSPSTASSYSKRRRRDDADADAASEASSPSKVSRKSDLSNFGASHRPNLLQPYNDCCGCGVQYLLHVAHVFDKAAIAEFQSYRNRGLVSLETLGDYDNAIYLCAADHGAYDASAPLLVIAPKYLDFFFDTESNWQHELKESLVPLARPLITASDYTRHCKQRLGEFDAGPLYVAYPLADYKVKGQVGSASEFAWHGDPGAALWHAKRLLIATLAASPEPEHYSAVRHIRRRLLDLQDLYEEGDKKWKFRVEPADAASQTASSGQDGDAGAGAQSPSPKKPQPPPSAPQTSSSGSANRDSQYPQFPTTYSLDNTPLFLDTPNLKRMRAETDVEDAEQKADFENTLHTPIPVTHQSRKRWKPAAVRTRAPHQKNQQPSNELDRGDGTVLEYHFPT